MKFFRNMDEMELHLSLNAIRVAWFFTVMALFIWGIWDCVHTGRFTAPMYLLIFQNLLYFLALQVGRWRAGDRDGARSFLLYVPLLVVFLLAFGLAALLDKPNNNLAVEYCKAILELGAALVPIPLPRQGAGHGQALTETGGQFASASALRTLWQNGGADAAAPYVPAEVLPLYREAFAAGQYTDLAAAQRCQLALLRSRCAGTAPFAQVRGISEGLEHRLEAAVRSSTTHAELLDSLTTVRYPRARMRRLAMDAALDYSADAFPALPPYLHLLGGKKDALPFLKNCTLPVSHSLARLRGSGGASARMAEAQLAAADFGTLCRVSPEAMGGLLRQKNIFLT